MTTTESRPRRRIALRVTLGGLMLVIVALAAWLGWVTNRARTQKKAVEAIVARGGTVSYAHQYVGLKYVKDAETPGPKWLRRRIGDDYFQTPIRAFVYRAKQRPGLARDRRMPIPPPLPHDDDIMEAFASLPELENVGFDRGPTTDAGLARLRGLKNLRYLDLPEADDLTDAGLAQLAGFIKLENLTIKNASRITDACVAKLAGLKALTTLEIPGDNLTDASLKVIGGFKALEVLHLGLRPGGFPRPVDDAIVEGRIGDDGLAALEGLTRLTNLYLPASRATDAGLAHLAKLERLEKLAILAGPISPRGLASIRGLSRLDFLSLASPEIAEGALDPIPDLPALKMLNLRCPRLSDGSLNRLAHADQLTSLVLNCPGLTDDQLLRLAPLKKLKGLLVHSGEMLTDQAIENLRGLDSLEGLAIATPTLSGVVPTSRITDRGLAATSAFPALKSVNIGSPAITKAAVNRLKKERPGLRVITPATPSPPPATRPTPKNAAAPAR